MTLEHTPRPGTTWETTLRPLEQLVEDGQPEPRPNRATRRAMTHPAQYTAECLRLQADHWFPRLSTEEHEAMAGAEAALRRIAGEDLTATRHSAR